MLISCNGLSHTMWLALQCVNSDQYNNVFQLFGDRLLVEGLHVHMYVYVNDQSTLVLSVLLIRRPVGCTYYVFVC